jgi:PBP1b-binding outer membrane lipoprotein LpoB
MRMALPALMLLAGCVEEPTPKDAEKAAEAIEQNAVEEKRKSIEEAAEEAVRVIEADAKAEIDEISSETAE